jgi:preprotein translocase subunit SecF
MKPLFKLIPDDTNIDFLKARKLAIAFSLFMVIASIVLVATKGFNLGVDFVGGQTFHVTMAKVEPVDEVRERIAGLDLGEATIQQFGSPRDLAIRLPVPPGDVDAAAESAAKVRAEIGQAYPGVKFNSVETVSGKVSEELAWDGALSLLLAMLGISIYIWFRFEWQFGVGALVSLVHDLTITLGFFALTQIEFDLNVVAALLTLIGYSLNDTVVVYDRIRENLRKYRKMEIEPLLNLSVNETLSRTVATNGAVLLAVLGLVFIGPATIFGLTIGILFGVIIGTYSSIYVARFALVPLGVSADSFVPEEGVASKAERIDEGYGAQP